jgi:ABC-2 type transport system ATP-binding protein
MGAIETSGLTKYYGKTLGVEDLDLRVEEGEVFGFLGPNGAGKTTTIRLLLGLIHPTKGQAKIFGSTLDFRSHAYRRDVGYLPGEPGFYSHLSGREFLARLSSLRGSNGRDKAEKLAGRLDFDLSRKIKGLSHGTRQKLAIVAALMHDAKLLILDEPTSGLDPLAQQVFYEMIQEESDQGRTVFLSSHLLGEVERTCSRVGVIRAGRLVVVEDISDLKRKRVKWLEADLEGEVKPDNFRLPGVRSAEIEGQKLKLSIEGNYSEILKVLAARRIENVTIQDATLEEIFLEYYSGDKEDKP